VDLLFVAGLGGWREGRQGRDPAREPGDVGLRMRVSPVTRKLAECERFDPEPTPVGVFADGSRLVTGDASSTTKLAGQSVSKLLQREYKNLMVRTARADAGSACESYGDTLFHLEPNIKGLPGWAAGRACVRVDGKAAGGGGSGEEKATMGAGAGWICEEGATNFVRRWSFCGWCDASTLPP